MPTIEEMEAATAPIPHASEPATSPVEPPAMPFLRVPKTGLRSETPAPTAAETSPAPTEEPPAPTSTEEPPSNQPPEPGPAPTPTPTQTAPPVKKVDLEIELLAALEQGLIKSQIKGNGREQTRVILRSNYPETIKTAILPGQILESGRNAVMILRGTKVEIPPGKSFDQQMETVALHSANKVEDGDYKFSYQTSKKLDLLLIHLADHPELSAQAAQTAALALTENLPLYAVAKFECISAPKNRLVTEGFRVETNEILAALTTLKTMGIDMTTVVMNNDPQLRIEAMIEPLSRELAKRYYGISESQEWDFWKKELLQGPPGTRHYALYGIARFYPDIAIEMLPKWARETQTHTVFRLSAIQALADTQRPEAIAILRQLANELGPNTELGKAAAETAKYLDAKLSSKEATKPQGLNFRGKKGLKGL